MPKILSGSKETTLGGLFTGLALILGELAKQFDNDPATNMEIAIIVASLGMIITFWRARDDNKSSEDVGIK